MGDFIRWEDKLRLKYRALSITEMAFIFSLVLGVVWLGAHLITHALDSQDEYSLQSDRQVLLNVLGDRLLDLERLVVDYTYWDDAVENLGENFDPKWADANVGYYVNDNQGIDLSAVIAADDRLLIMFVDGKQVEEGLDTGSEVVQALIAKGRAGRLGISQVASGYFVYADKVYRLAAFPLTPEAVNRETESAWTRAGVHNTLLLFASEISPSSIQKIARAFNLDGLALQDRGCSEGALACVDLLDFTATPLASITFVPKQPGSMLLQRLSAQLVLLAVLVVFLLMWVLIRPLVFASQMARKNDELQSALDILDRYVLYATVDNNRHVTAISSALSEASGFSKEELLGKPCQFDVRPEQNDEIWQRLRVGELWEGEVKSLNKDGAVYWAKASMEPIFDRHGKISGYTSVRQDITDRKKVEALSITDQLTGLYNRMKLDQVFSDELERIGRAWQPLSILLLDVDHFKAVNDSHGHQVGDRVLQQVAALLRETVRQNDVVGRWGGEEFLIICLATGIEGANALAEKIRLVIEQHEFAVVGRVTVSQGVAALQPGETEEHLIARADQGLYQAKRDGRNRVVVMSL